jgi:hypothetical protein
MTEAGANSGLKKVDSKKEGKKRAREESESDAAEVEPSDRGRKMLGRNKDVEWKRWMKERLEKVEQRTEQIEEALGKIAGTMEAICEFLRKAEEPEGSDQGSEEEEVEDQTLRDAEGDSEVAAEVADTENAGVMENAVDGDVVMKE